MVRRCAAVLFVTLWTAPAAQAAWPGGNGLITFSSGGDVQTTPAPGGAWTAITSDPADDAQASWSPDGRRIAFRGGAEGDREVFIAGADGAGRVRLTDTPAPGTYSSQPSWSPDGSRLLFRSDRDGDPDVWSMAADGSDVRQVTNFPGDERYPAFAPDGRSIVLRSDMDGDPEIYLVSTAGAVLRKLTDNGVFDSGPTWSPDGRRIAFERAGVGIEAPRPAGPADVYVIGADGRGERRLTTDPAHDEGPAWAPDGTKLLFTSERAGNSDIWVMNPDGSGQAPVTTAPSKEESPEWQSVAGACRVTAGPVRLSTLRRRGLRVRLRCPRPASAQLTLTAAGRTLAEARRARGKKDLTVVLRVRGKVPSKLRLTVTTTDAFGRRVTARRSVRVSAAS